VKRVKETVEYFLFRAVQRMARLLSYHAAERLGRFLGMQAYWLTASRRRVALENLTHAFPEKSHQEIRAIAHGAFMNYGISLVEMLWSGQAKREELANLVELVNPEVAYRALEKGKGVILLSGHFGSWELLVSSFLIRLGWGASVIVQLQRNKRINAIIDAQRRRFNVTTIPMGPSVREVLKTLQEKGVLFVLGDQSGPKESLFIDFFGRPAATHKGTAAFSLRTGAPIIFVALLRQKDGTHKAVFEEVDRSGLDSYSEENVAELTRRHTAVLERHIRQFPDHWLWMHKRWKHTEYFQSLHSPTLPHTPVNQDTE
jgi:Kdo2-lipid IVA lauroyltransferase/acyltransferase